MPPSDVSNKECNNNNTKKKIAIGAGFVGTLAMVAGIAGASWSASSAIREQTRMSMEDEEDLLSQAEVSGVFF